MRNRALTPSARDIGRGRQVTIYHREDSGACGGRVGTRIGAPPNDIRSQSPAPPGTRRLRPRAMSNVLLFVAALVFAMVVIGGITRLTESGLSITEWKLIVGADPAARRHAEWQRAFDLYGDTAIPRGRGPGRNDPVRLQVHLFLGVGAPAAGPDHRLGLLRRDGLVRGQARDSARLWLAAGGLVRARRRCRGRSAGSWSCPGSRAAPRSAPIDCRPICCWRCSCCRTDLDRARPAAAGRHLGRRA